MKKKPGFVLQSIGEENVLICETVESINLNCVVALNETASYLWKEIGDGEFTADDLALLLTREYEVDADRAKADAEEVIKAWLKAGLLSL